MKRLKSRSVNPKRQTVPREEIGDLTVSVLRETASRRIREVKCWREIARTTEVFLEPGCHAPGLPEVGMRGEG